MYCHECNMRLMGNEKYCPNCGSKVDNSTEVITTNNSSKNESTEGSRSASVALGVLSLVGVFLGVFSPIALILSIIGLILAIKSNKNVKNTIGIVLNSVGLFLSFIVTLLIIFVIYLAVDIYQKGTDSLNEHISDWTHEVETADNYGENF